MVNVVICGWLDESVVGWILNCGLIGGVDVEVVWYCILIDYDDGYLVVE